MKLKKTASDLFGFSGSKLSLISFLRAGNEVVSKFRTLSHIPYSVDIIFFYLVNSWANNSIQNLLHLIKDEKLYFKDMIWIEHFDKKVVFVKPKHNSQRLINQAGLLALFGMDNGEKKDLCSKDYIGQLKTALGILGVTQDKVYPEMENASKYVKEIFKNKE